jgi:hypothetical protein
MWELVLKRLIHEFCKARTGPREVCERMASSCRESWALVHAGSAGTCDALCAASWSVVTAFSAIGYISDPYLSVYSTCRYLPGIVRHVACYTVHISLRCRRFIADETSARYRSHISILYRSYIAAIYLARYGHLVRCRTSVKG